MYIYIYMYIHIHTYIHTYKYTYIHTIHTYIENKYIRNIHYRELTEINQSKIIKIIKIITKLIT